MAKVKNTWRLSDLMRLAHPRGIHPGVGSFILRGEVSPESPAVIRDFARAQRATSTKEIVDILSEGTLPWEAVPTSFHKEPKVWKTLFYSGQLTGQALVRNITRLARMDAFSDMKFAADYATKLTDEDMIRKARLHPIAFLNAAVVHSEGQLQRRGYWSSHRERDWKVSSVISSALNEGFYTAFKHVEPAGKRTMIAIDVSSSMTQPAMGLDLTCAQVAGAMAMTIARTEPMHLIYGFSHNSKHSLWGNSVLAELNIGPATSLERAMDEVQQNTFGGTDCALPMTWATENKVDVDTFIVITDNETYAGKIQPHQALDQYNRATGNNARLAVLGVASNGFTIAQPGRSDMLDVVGFSADTPKVVADFSAGRL